MFKKIMKNKIINPIYVEYYYNHLLRTSVLRGLFLYEDNNNNKYKMGRSYGFMEDKKRGFRICLKKRQIK